MNDRSNDETPDKFFEELQKAEREREEYIKNRTPEQRHADMNVDYEEMKSWEHSRYV